MIAVGIDIGTNTALMVVASITPQGSYSVVQDVHTLPRLGEGLDRNGVICEAARERARASMETFRRVIYEASNGSASCTVYAVATSALREAANGPEVCAELESILGWPINVISGMDEAELTYAGAVGEDEASACMIDIGGGSTEYASGHSGELAFRMSTALGVVRCMERFVASHPISDRDQQDVRQFVRQELANHADQIRGFRTFIGTAGTPTALAMIDLGLPSFDATSIEGHQLARSRVDDLAQTLCAMTLPELRAIPGLDERRADIVPIGSLILSESLNMLDYPAVRVSTKGLRHGALLHAIRQREMLCP